MHQSSLDIVIPSFRVDEKIIQQILSLPHPAHFSISFYIVVDNPGASVSSAILSHPSVTVLVNEKNLGPGESRNRGIRAGAGEWILFLDDDVIPENNLLYAYARAIAGNFDAVGFGGVTDFPPPINAATEALVINGSISHFQAAIYYRTLPWAPTANVVVKRKYLHPDLFDRGLITAEDIDLLVRSSLLAGKRYVSASEAIVKHPWWNGGRIQTRRMFSYGRGASQIAVKKPIIDYTYLDFTNTVETLLLLLALLPVAIYFQREKMVLWLALAVALAEFLTGYIKVIITGKTASMSVACNLVWVKNCYEAGALFQTLVSGRLNAFARRIDTGFSKLNPSHFRTNRWKIIKLALLGLMILIGAVTFRAAK